MKNNLGSIILVIIICIFPIRFIHGYLTSYDYSAGKRKELAKLETGDIDIAIMSNSEDNAVSFINGVEMALREENKEGFTFEKHNRIFKKKMVMHYFSSTKPNNQVMTKAIANDHKIVAVVAYLDSALAIASSVTFEQHGVLFVSTSATDQRLTNHGFKYTFSTIPPDKDYAQALVDFSVHKNYKNIAYLYSRDGSYGINVCKNFSSLLVGKNINIVSSHSFDPAQDDYRQLIYEVMQSDPDAILLGAVGTKAAKLINQLRTMGIREPIMGSDGLDYPEIWEESDKKFFNAYVASLYIENPSQGNETSGSRNDGKVKFANYSTKQGYEAVKILAAAIRKSNSIVPITVAATLKYNLTNAFGNYNFDSSGRILHSNIFVKVMKDGAFYSVSDNEGGDFK